jgi:four helix bundle protein
MKASTFRNLKVWEKAHKLVLNIYKITALFPSEEKFGLISQMRRAAYSIPVNIVEGHKRRSRKEYLHFLNIADGSLEEIKYFILLSYDLNYCKKENFLILNNQCDEIGRMLWGLQRGLLS